jgi:hypothetical protein
MQDIEFQVISQEVAERFCNLALNGEGSQCPNRVIHVVSTMPALGPLYPQLRL